MKKSSRIGVARKNAVKGTGSFKKSASVRSVISGQYVAAMRTLTDTNRDEITSLAAITERLSKAK